MNWHHLEGNSRCAQKKQNSAFQIPPGALVGFETIQFGGAVDNAPAEDLE